MVTVLVNFADLLLAALLVGAMFGAWLIFNPSGLSGDRYIAIQQQGIRTLHPPMPPLGALTIVATLTAAVIARADHLRLLLLLAAAICFGIAGLITRLYNQPINAVVMTWTSERLPADWTVLSDRWWRWHGLRLVSVLGGLSLLIAAALQSWPVD